MKKLTLTVLTTMAAVTLFAQGTVNFQNASTSLLTNGLSNTSLPVGTTFRVALYFLPDTGATPTTADFDLAGQVLGNSTGVARWLVDSLAEPELLRLPVVRPVGSKSVLGKQPSEARMRQRRTIRTSKAVVWH